MTFTLLILILIILDLLAVLSTSDHPFFLHVLHLDSQTLASPSSPPTSLTAPSQSPLLVPPLSPQSLNIAGPKAHSWDFFISIYSHSLTDVFSSRFSIPLYTVDTKSVSPAYTSPPNSTLLYQINTPFRCLMDITSPTCPNFPDQNLLH